MIKQFFFISLIIILFVNNTKAIENRILYKKYKNNIIYINRIMYSPNQYKRSMFISWIFAKNPYIKYDYADAILKSIINTYNKLYLCDVLYINNNEYIQNLDMLILAIIATESNFRYKSISNKGAIGLTQILPTSNILKYLNATKPKSMITINKSSLLNIDVNIMSSFLLLDNYIKILVIKNKKFKYLSNKDKIKKILYKYLGAKNKRYFMKIYLDYKKLIFIKNKL